MLPDIEKLLELQTADKEIRKLQDEVAALPKRVAVIEQKLAGTKAHLEKVRLAAKGDEANRKNFEANIKDLQGKISKYRDQSLDVKTNDHSVVGRCPSDPRERPGGNFLRAPAHRRTGVRCAIHRCGVSPCLHYC